MYHILISLSYFRTIFFQQNVHGFVGIPQNKIKFEFVIFVPDTHTYINIHIQVQNNLLSVCKCTINDKIGA